MGAESFHGPVRDGKGWVQLAMGVKLKRVTGRLMFLLPTRVGRSLLFLGMCLVACLWSPVVIRGDPHHLWRCELSQSSLCGDHYSFDACEL